MKNHSTLNVVIILLALGREGGVSNRVPNFHERLDRHLRVFHEILVKPTENQKDDQHFET